MRKQNHFEQLEKEIIELILKTESEYAPSLREQFINAKVLSREFTGCGFFTKYLIEDPSHRLSPNISFALGDVEAIVDKVTTLGFILFIEDGMIDTLEGYTYGEQSMYEDFTTFELKRF